LPVRGESTALETALRQICGYLTGTRHAFALGADIAVAVASDAEAETLVRNLRSTGYKIEAVVEQEAVGRPPVCILRNRT
jgi:hypothetical protein